VVLKFGTSGIRGIINETLFFEDIVKLSFACKRAIKGPYCIGRDGRKNSKLVSNIIMATLNLYGEDVLDFGMIPTPVLAFGTKKFKRNLGFQVTASHNPPSYVGIKIFNKKGMQLPRDLEIKIEKNLEGNLKNPRAKRGKTTEYNNLIYDYIDKILEALPKTRKKFRILIDSGNGMASLVVPKVLEDLGHKVISINDIIDWRFSARPSEPTKENLDATAKMVKSLDVDFAFAYDGDADRAVIINRRGEVLPDHIFTSLVLKILLKDRRGNVILSVNTSNSVEEIAKNAGCKVIRAKLGKTYEKLIEYKGIFASEPSKIIDPKWGFWEDGMYGSLLLTQSLSFDELNLEEMVKDIPVYYYKQVNLPIIKDLEKFKRKILEEDFGKEVLEINELDGIKLIFKDSWILFRLSGTEPKVRIYAESKDYNELNYLIRKGESLISSEWS